MSTHRTRVVTSEVGTDVIIAHLQVRRPRNREVK